MKKWGVLVVLAAAQFVMILDSSVMNVSISAVADDLGTTISGMQAAITLYALTMASLMLTGGKLGDIWGRLRAFQIGSVVYGVGSLTTALAPNLGVLLVGWSLVEGLGAIMVIPAIAALAAVSYQGRERVVAFSVLGAVTGLAAAVGPIIGGFVTTYFSWRWVFAAETVVMLGVLWFGRSMADEPVQRKPVLDWLSVLLSAAGLGMLVFGVLQSKTWGWIEPLSVPTVGDVEVAPFGISIVAYLILAGVVVLAWFWRRQQRLERSGRDALLKVSMLRLPVLRSGLSMFLAQYFIIAAIFFVVPVYLQTILGFDALETGLKLVPLSVGLVLCSLAGSRLSDRQPPKRIARLGQVLMAVGVLVLLASVSEALRGWLFGTGMFVVGSGFGLLASQLGNVNMSAVGRSDSAEVGGLQGTFQNLGTSFGTALVGSVFMLALTSGFVDAVQASGQLSPEAKDAIVAQADEGVQIVSQDQAQQYVEDQGGSAETAATVGDLYEEAQIDALRQGLFLVFAMAVLSLVLARNLPDEIPVRTEPAEQPAERRRRDAKPGPRDGTVRQHGSSAARQARRRR